MKDYKKSDYALNKNRKGIVYRNADGSTLEITFEKIAEGKPQFTQEDFDKLKSFSDQIYLEQVRADAVYQKHVKGRYDEFEDSKWLKTKPLEDDLFQYWGEKELQTLFMKLMQKLTPIQRRRFFMYMKGISTVKIAEIEGCNQNAVWKSICQAKCKLKNFLKIFKIGW